MKTKKKIYFLLIIFIIFSLLIFWIDFNLFPLIPTKHNSDNINNLLRIVSLSYNSSFVFYFIVVYLNEIKERKNSKEYIKSKINEIIGLAEHLRDKIEKIDDIQFINFIPEENALIAKLNKINLEDDAKAQRLYPFTYEQLFQEHANEIKERIDRLLILLPYMDSRLVNLLNLIYDCPFLKLATKSSPAKLINQKIKELNAPNFATVHVGTIIQYLKLIHQLRNTRL